MKLAIMQPYFLPYIGYFQLINTVDLFVYYDDVNFINRGWINRNRILVNGNPQYITIPLQNASQNKLINQLYIVEDNKWRKKMLKTIELNYKKKPYYHDVFPVIEEIVNLNETHLYTFISNSFDLIFGYLHMEIRTLSSSNLNTTKSNKGVDRILSICKDLGANEYYNLIGGVELYDQRKFMEKDIKLHFIKTDEKFHYSLKSTDFHPYLSILDVLMKNSREETVSLLHKYSTI